MTRLSILPALMVAALAAAAASVPAFAQAQELTPVRLRLDWRPGAQHAPFYYGKAKGLFEAQGIDLEIISGSGSSDTVKQVGSGAVEFGLADALVLVQATAQDVPDIAIAAYYQKTPTVVLSPADKPVTSPEQLTGEVKLGNKKGSATSQGLSAMLSANDISEEDINAADVGFGVQPLLAGQVDAMMGFAMNEPIEAETAGMKVSVMPVSDFGVDAYGLTIITNEGLASSKPDLVKGFLRATLEAMAATASERDAAVQAVAEAVAEVDTAREMRVLDLTVPYWIPEGQDAKAIGMQTDERWQHTAKMAQDVGLVDAAPPTDAIFTTSFMPN